MVVNNIVFFCFFKLTANLGLVFNLFVQYSQSELPPLRPLCGEAPGRDLNPGRTDLVAGTLTTRPPPLVGRRFRLPGFTISVPKLGSRFGLQLY